jgi:hypothetical protein
MNYNIYEEQLEDNHLEDNMFEESLVDTITTNNTNMNTKLINDSYTNKKNTYICLCQIVFFGFICIILIVYFVLH